MDLFKDHDANRIYAAWPGCAICHGQDHFPRENRGGSTPIRESDIQSKAMTDMAPKLGGLVEFLPQPGTGGLDAHWHQACLDYPSWPSCGGRRMWPRR